MSDALRSFFREHHAVPATDRGPDWKNGRTEALEGHLYGLMEACNRDETGATFARVRKEMATIARHLETRTDLSRFSADEVKRAIAVCDPPAPAPGADHSDTCMCPDCVGGRAGRRPPAY